MNGTLQLQSGEREPQRNALVIFAVMAALFVSAFSQTVAGTALPRIIGELGGINLYSWVLTASMLAATAAAPLVGKLSDLYGRKVFIMGGIIVFMAASAATGAAQNMAQLIAFRAVQGLGGGTIMASAFATIGDLFSPAERGRYFGLFTGVFAVASVTGPLVGGFLTDHWGWRWVFYVNLPFGLLALAILAHSLPARRMPERTQPIDWLGMATLLSCVLPLLFALAWAGDRFPWGSWQIAGLMFVAALGLLAFVAAERWAADPVLPLFLLQNRTFVVASVMSFLTGMGLFGALSYMPLYIQGVLGASATNSGLVNMPLMVGLAAASMIAGHIASRTGRYRWTIVAGGAVLVVGMALTLPFDEHTALAVPVAAMVVVGFGLGLSTPLLGVAVQNALSDRMLGVASASSQFFREIGGTLGVALSGTLITTQLHEHLISRLPPDVTSSAPDDLVRRLENPRILLSPSALGKMREAFTALGGDGPALYAKTVGAMRSVLADGVHDVFFVGLIVALLVFGAGLLLPDLPLRTREAVPIGELLTHPGFAWGDVAGAAEGRALQDVLLAGDAGDVPDLTLDRSTAGVGVPGG
jgi:EmrB/QacA subfamily drug resistance transporter